MVGRVEEIVEHDVLAGREGDAGQEGDVIELPDGIEDPVERHALRTRGSPRARHPQPRMGAYDGEASRPAHRVRGHGRPASWSAPDSEWAGT